MWYLDRAYDWHFLAPNFTTYFRMMLVHLGLPQWQALFTPFGPTPWAKVGIKIAEFSFPTTQCSCRIFEYEKRTEYFRYSLYAVRQEHLWSER